MKRICLQDKVCAITFIKETVNVIYLKGTVTVILRNPHFTYWNVRFSTIPFKPL